MKIRLTLFVLVFPMLAEVLLSCNDSDDRPVMTIEVSNCLLNVRNLSNTGPSPEVSYANSIDREAYGIRLKIQRQEHSCEVKSDDIHFINAARAIYPHPNYIYKYISLEEVTKLTVISINDFDQQHPAGADVTELFRVRAETDFKYYTVDAYVDRLSTESFGYENRNLEFDLFLMEPAQTSTEHQFKLILNLSDGRILEDLTDTIEFI